MLRSLAAFIFGSNTPANENFERNNCFEKEQHSNIFHVNDLKACFDKDKTIIEESLSTPIITGGSQKLTRNKDRPKTKKDKSKKQAQFTNTNLKSNLNTVASEDLDTEENDWIFLEKEEDINLSENSNTTSAPNLEISYELQPMHACFPGNNINKGSREKTNKNGQKRNHKRSLGQISTSFREGVIEKEKELSLLNSASLNLSRNSLNEDRCNEATGPNVLLEYEVPQSLQRDLGPNVSLNSCAKLFTMVDSWYMTPPTCFDSAGSIHLEVSPIENLLIEHPCMPIYRNIGSAQREIENFENFNIEVDEINHIETSLVNTPHKCHRKRCDKENKNTPPACGERSSGSRINRHETSLLKMQLFALNSQKSLAIRERHNLRRNAILRSNQVREIQSRCNRQRRTDLQHCRLNSGVNNNRKCC